MIQTVDVPSTPYSIMLVNAFPAFQEGLVCVVGAACYHSHRQSYFIMFAKAKRLGETLASSIFLIKLNKVVEYHVLY